MLCKRVCMHSDLASSLFFALLWLAPSLRVLMTKTEVTLGRATADNAVDMNIAEEAEVQGNKVSRQQATIKLKEDGRFYMRNIGRKVMHVNGMLVDRGQRAVLPDSCLIEVGGASFVFEANFVVVNRLLMQARGKRSGPESMGSASESDQRVLFLNRQACLVQLAGTWRPPEAAQETCSTLFQVLHNCKLLSVFFGFRNARHGSACFVKNFSSLYNNSG